MKMTLGDTYYRCLRGLHVLSADNVWIRPSDGRRYCKACRKATRRAYYLTLSETTGFPTIYSPQPRRNEYHWYNFDTQTRLTWAELFWDEKQLQITLDTIRGFVQLSVYDEPHSSGEQTIRGYTPGRQ